MVKTYTSSPFAERGVIPYLVFIKMMVEKIEITLSPDIYLPLVQVRITIISTSQLILK